MISSLRLLHLVEQVHDFCSLQIHIPDSLSDHLYNIRLQIPDDCINYDEDVGSAHFLADEHITAFYGLDTNDIESIAHFMRGQKPFPVTILGKTATFTNNEKFNVVVLPVTSQELVDLHYALRKVVKKEPPTYKDFKPHTTIAYTKKDYKPVLQVPFTKFTFICEELQFCFKDECPIEIPVGV